MQKRSRSRKFRSKGNTLIEFTLVGIPILFVLICIFEVSRGMWVYHTLTNAVREGTRFAIVHGQDCATAPNVCQVTIADIATRIRNEGVGLLPDQLMVTFAVNVGSDADLGDGNDIERVGPDTLANHLNNTALWPTVPTAARGVGDVEIRATYRFRSALALFWPGSAPVSFGDVLFGSRSRHRVQF